ncbi:MAG: cysteine desulfurase [Deltaproteobacteria bacterium]|nr:cysteine desulfurase [Deltaproteobacteria bacterium]
MRRIYLDYAATTPCLPEVVTAMLPYFSEHFGNASSLHAFGFQARKALEKSRATVACLLGCALDDVFFTSSGTESNNMALQGCLSTAAVRPAHMITTVMEHTSAYATCRYLENLGHELTVLSADSEGRIDPAGVEAAIRHNTVLISVQYVNNEIGTVQPIEAIAAVADSAGILLHTDAVQAVGKLPIDMRSQKIDMLSASGHKFYGPKGTGLLCLNRTAAAAKMHARKHLFNGDTLLQPLMHGGKQEAGLRPATENVAGIVGLAKALELAAADMAQESARLEALRDNAIDWLLQAIVGVRLNGPRIGRIANNINICIPGVNGYELMLLLDRYGIACSTGAACSTQSEKPSRVLTAIGLSPLEALESLRLTLGKYIVKDDIDYVIGKLVELISTLKQT